MLDRGDRGSEVRAAARVAQREHARAADVLRVDVADAFGVDDGGADGSRHRAVIERRHDAAVRRVRVRVRVRARRGHARGDEDRRVLEQVLPQPRDALPTEVHRVQRERAVARCSRLSSLLLRSLLLVVPQRARERPREHGDRVVRGDERARSRVRSRVRGRVRLGSSRLRGEKRLHRLDLVGGDVHELLRQPRELQVVRHPRERPRDRAPRREPRVVLEPQLRERRLADIGRVPQGRSIQANVGVEFKGVSWS